MLPGFGGRLRGVAFCVSLSASVLACGATKIDRSIGVGEGSSSGLATPSVDASSTVDPTTGAGTTHAAIEPCEAHLSASGCDAAGCIWFASERVVDLATCALAPVGFCATASGSTADDTHDSTFFKRVGGVLQLQRVGHRSCDRSGSAHPEGWTECGLGPDDPPECACVCAAGQCPGELALELLDTCALPAPCADIGPDWGGAACLYQALAAGAPASLRMRIDPAGAASEQRVYLRGDGTAQWIRSACADDCLDCSDPTWELPRACSVREPAYFSACAASDDPAVLAACRDPATWFSACIVAPATCP